MHQKLKYSFAFFQASHLLVKHRESRRPASWRSDNITRSKEEALEILQGYERQVRQLPHGEIKWFKVYIVFLAIIIAYYFHHRSNLARRRFKSWLPSSRIVVLPNAAGIWVLLAEVKCRNPSRRPLLLWGSVLGFDWFTIWSFFSCS